MACNDYIIPHPIPNLLKHVEVDEEKLTSIQKFFVNTKIFLTGGTGFLGILLLEKLLASCSNISTIYMLVRPKRGKDVQTRLDELFDDAVFYRLRKQLPDFRKKIVIVQGDCELPQLGLNVHDKAMLSREVDIVFHAAATVRFDEGIRKAAFTNIRGLRDVVRLARNMPNLKSFVHVSTAYSNCVHSFIKEDIYPPSMDYKSLLKVTEALPDDILTAITPMLLEKYPNTYTYSKQIGEDVIRQEGIGLPVGISRPPVVISTYREPVRGWNNNVHSITGMLAACGLGVIRSVINHKEKESHMVPADIVVNSIIASAWDIGHNYREINKTDKIPVYNIVAAKKTSHDNIGRQLTKWNIDFPSARSMWPVFVVKCRSQRSYAVVSLFVHTIPAFLADVARLCIGKPPKLMKMYRKIDKFNTVLSYFETREWEFESDNTEKLIARMSHEDREIFFCDTKDFGWDEFMPHFGKGMRMYLMKDPMETVPQGRKRMRRLYWLHQFTLSAIGGFLLWILWLLFSLLISYYL